MSSPPAETPYSRHSMAHRYRTSHIDLIRPATTIEACVGWVFTPVFAPLVDENEERNQHSALGLAARAQKDTPYGVAIYRTPSTNTEEETEDDSENEPLIIGGHEQPVQAITTREFKRTREREESQDVEDDDSESPQPDEFESDVLLVTASMDRIILWTLSEIQSCLTADPPRQPAGRVLPARYDICSMSLDSSSTKLALCLASTGVVVLDLETGAVDAVLEGHIGRVNQASFVPGYMLLESTSWNPSSPSLAQIDPSSSFILTLGQDRTFKLWDVGAVEDKRKMLWTSSIVSASPFVRVEWERPAHSTAAPSGHTNNARMILATEDGKIRVYDWSKVLPALIARLTTNDTTATTSMPLPRLIHTLDLDAISRKLHRAFQIDESKRKRKKELSASPDAKVIRASPTGNANLTANEQLYRPFMATEGNMPGGGGGVSEEELLSPSEREAEDAPATILAMTLRTCRSTSVNLAPVAASSASSSSSSSAPQPKRSPAASPSASPVRKPAPSPGPSNSPPPPIQSVSSNDTLYVASTRGVSRVNLRTFEVEWFGGFVGSAGVEEELAASPFSSTVAALTLSALPLGRAAHAAFATSPDSDESDDADPTVQLVCSSPFLPQISLVSLIPEENSGASNSSRSSISIFSLAPLPSSSPLRSWSWSTASAAGKNKSSAPGKRGAKPGQIGARTDHNIVFHTRIKSSGYGVAASTPSGKKPLNLGGLHQKANTTSGRAHAASLAAGRKPSASPPPEKRYLMDCPPINTLSPNNPSTSKTPPLHNGPILSASFSTEGKRLLTASLDSTASSVRWPPWKHVQGTSQFVGHKKPLRCAAWAWRALSAPATKDDLVLTSSSDGTARLWALGKADPLLVFDRKRKNAEGDVSGASTGVASSSSSSAAAKPGSSASSQENPVFTAEIPACSFFRQNQLILLAHKNQLLFYKYFIDPAKTNTDLKKLQNLNKYKLLTSYTDPSSHTLTTFACINSFLSTLVVLADSGRGLTWFDASVGKVVRHVSDAHGKSIHCITMNAPSPFVANQGEAMMDAQQLFATVATDSAIKLWDVRQKDCLRRFVGHVNRSASIRASFSPCGRYLASGSEDNRAYVFDIRNGNICEKLGGATDVVSDVAYHPLMPQLVTTCYDGRIRCYTTA